MKNKIKTIAAAVVVALMAASATVAFACIDMSGSTVGCDGTQNVLELCSCIIPVIACTWENCTGTSPGSPYPDAGIGSSGSGGASPRIGLCSATIYFAHCCSDTVSQASVYGTYGYAVPDGTPCGG
ncbi:MAG TPA: hypothetical protein VNN22_06780 [Verrucomicrobiae bacterium]|nr:hypothetical protein [Verrucomicrobiae bacterium]